MGGIKGELYTPQELQQILQPLVDSLERLPQIQKIRQKNKKAKNNIKNKTVIIGLQGGQGTGKTTLARFLTRQLRSKGHQVISFSLDDFYQSSRQRKKLQKQYPDNPFYQISRGMPGTHRVSLLKKTLHRLKQGKDVQLPVFDKSLHDGFGDISKRTISVRGRQDFVIIEGWCLGIPVVSSKELVRICRKNKINLRGLDPPLQHHKIVLRHLQQYQPLWKGIDYLIMLKPDFPDLHLRWRIQQEQELRKSTGRAGMTNSEINHFVQVYLPLTYVGYEKVKADTLLKINKEHRMYTVVYFSRKV